MSEPQEPYQLDPSQEQPVDPHTAIYQQLRRGFEQNGMLYEYLSSDVLKMLPGSHPQAIEDALNMACVSLGKTPLESLVLIHEFLCNYHSIMQHEVKPVEEPESPFFGRGKA